MLVLLFRYWNMDYITQLGAFDNLNECSIAFLTSVAFHCISKPIPWNLHPCGINVNGTVLMMWCILLCVGAWVPLSSYDHLVVLPIYGNCFILFYHYITPNCYFCYHWHHPRKKIQIVRKINRCTGIRIFFRFILELLETRKLDKLWVYLFAKYSKVNFRRDKNSLTWNEYKKPMQSFLIHL